MKNGQAWLAGGLMLVAALLFYRMYLKSTEETTAALDSRQQALQELGEYLNQQQLGSCTVVLSNPFTQKSGQPSEIHKFERAGIRGLEQGLGESAAVEIVFPTVKPEYRDNPQKAIIPRNSKTPLSFLIEPGSLDELAEAHPDCNLMVSLIGLPLGVDKLKVWDKQSPMQFALLLPDLRMVGSMNNVVSAFKSGKIAAAVVTDKQANAPLLITPENIKEILTDRPNLVGFPKKR